MERFMDAYWRLTHILYSINRMNGKVRAAVIARKQAEIDELFGECCFLVSKGIVDARLAKKVEYLRWIRNIILEPNR
jgi:hypothetical protein